MKNILFIFFLTIFFTNNINSQKIIEMEKVNGIYEIPCKVNGIPMKFIFDTGASDVSISITEAKFLLKQGLLKKEDFIENVNYQIANGEIIEGSKINLKTIEIDGIILNNIPATVIYQQNAPLLLGQSAISKFGEYTILDNKLIVKQNTNSTSGIIMPEKAIEKNEIKDNGINCNPVKGVSFNAKNDFINLRIEPNLSSQNIISPKKDNFWLKCVEDSLANDFVKVKLHLTDSAFEEKGVNGNNYNFLYTMLNSKLGYNLNLENYFKLTSDDIKLKKIYYMLLTKKSFENWSDDASFYKKMKTFEGFKEYWTNFDRQNSDFKYIIDNQDKVFFVHKSDITVSNIGLIYNGLSADEYLDWINTSISQKEKNSCSYDEGILCAYLERYVNQFIDENPFQAIQKINSYRDYFELPENIYKIENLKLIAAYKDKNYAVAITVGKKIINAYKGNNEYIILDDKVVMYDNIEISEVYGRLISALIQENNIDEAYVISNECLKNESIQCEQFLEFHTYLLKKLNKPDEACEILNNEYLKGNLKARELIKSNCK